FLSHDIRGNLNAALLLAEVLRRELAREQRFQEMVNDLDLMRRSMLETVSTMDRFLAAEQLRQGKMPVKPASVDLHALLENVGKTFAYEAKDRDVQLVVESAKHANIVSDHDLL